MYVTLDLSLYCEKRQLKLTKIQSVGYMVQYKEYDTVNVVLMGYIDILYIEEHPRVLD